MTSLLTYDQIAKNLQQVLDEKNPQAEKFEKMDYLFSNLLAYYTEPFLIPFNSLFAQLSFAIAQLKISKPESFILHYYRIHFYHQHSNDEYQSVCDQAAIHILAAAIFQEKNKAPQLIHQVIAAIRPEKKHDRILPYCRMMIVRIDQELFYGIIENEPATEVIVNIDKANNEHLLNNLIYNLQYFELPIVVGLVGSKVKENVYSPDYIILNPDFLMDVTAIAECFGYNYVLSDLYFLKKFAPRKVTDAIFKGFIANYFLDELIRDPDLNYSDISESIFKLNPLFLSARNNLEIKQLLAQASAHFEHLKQIIKNQFPLQGIDIKHALLEPSFYAPEFGLQGRLDVLSIEKDYKTIVELKSGKIFKPNRYGLNHSNFIQTLLYNLLINPLRLNTTEIRTYILYSSELSGGLKFAPLTQSLQYEAMLVRNNMITIDTRLQQITANGEDLTAVFDIIDQLDSPLVSGYTKQALEIFKKCYDHLPSLHKKYFRAYTGFIAREFFLAKSGNLRFTQLQGQSALWNNSYIEKDRTFSILGFLQISIDTLQSGSATIQLFKTERTNVLADFRAGDVVVLYKSDNEGRFMWAGNQVFKGTLIENAPESISIRLRNPQIDLSIFMMDCFWNVEKDMMDSSFGHQYAALGTFLGADSAFRDRIIGKSPPRLPQEEYDISLPPLDEYFSSIIKPALNCRDYFLIWGPPGTGKTSQFARELIARMALNSHKPVLVIAYTNKAVDELCEAIEKIPLVSDHYIRIGSRYSTSPTYIDKLLDAQISGIHRRKDLVDFMQQIKVVCGTVSSILGKPELFDLLQFEWMIVDEASQILDPYIIELVSKVNRFIMIGDHKQLPAVVAQPAKLTQVTDSEMNEAGIMDLRLSMFERLFRQAVKNQWDWSYGILTKQGRMHADIMAFPAQNFYEGRLGTIFAQQQLPLPILKSVTNNQSDFFQLLATKRVLFIHVDDAHPVFRKMNESEAELICTILQDLAQIYQLAGEDLSTKQIGIITPFRAQIINIQNKLLPLDLHLNCTVDTVERFQGGAKDIILISMVVSTPEQLQMIASLNEDGLDRKMNVALTRARDRVIMLGNTKILKSSPYYARFIQEYLF